jgi:hypothetical protein
LRLVKAINVARKREILNVNVTKKRHNKKMCEFTQKQMLEEAAKTELENLKSLENLMNIEE